MQRKLFLDEPPLDELLQKDEYAALRADATKLECRMEETEDAGAIVTAARSLVETCYRHMLDSLAISYTPGDELTRMHKKAVSAMELHPDQLADHNLKLMIGGCASIVHGLGALRNSHSDAHGRHANHVPLTHDDARFAGYMAAGPVRVLGQSFERHAARKSTNDLNSAERQALLDAWLTVAKEYGFTDPDHLPFIPALEEIALAFTDRTGVILTRPDVHHLLVNARKAKKLPLSPKGQRQPLTESSDNNTLRTRSQG